MHSCCSHSLEAGGECCGGRILCRAAARRCGVGVGTPYRCIPPVSAQYPPLLSTFEGFGPLRSKGGAPFWNFPGSGLKRQGGGGCSHQDGASRGHQGPEMSVFLFHRRENTFELINYSIFVFLEPKMTKIRPEEKKTSPLFQGCRPAGGHASGARFRVKSASKPLCPCHFIDSCIHPGTYRLGRRKKHQPLSGGSGGKKH